jgi:hypothetical protein
LASDGYQVETELPVAIPPTAAAANVPRTTTASINPARTDGFMMSTSPGY